MCSSTILESLVAMKLREGFRIIHNSCIPFEQFKDRNQQYRNVPEYIQRDIARDQRRALEVQPLCEAVPGPFLIAENKQEDYCGDFDVSRQVQKERKGGTSIHQLAQYFHYPINEAAKLLDICPTVLKKICRRHGLRRWPHRKLKSIDKSIEKLEALMKSLQHDSGKEQQLAQTAAKLSDFKEERAILCFEMDYTIL